MGVHAEPQVYEQVRELLGITPGEPIFILRAQDNAAMHAIMEWTYETRSLAAEDTDAAKSAATFASADMVHNNDAFYKRHDDEGYSYRDPDGQTVYGEFGNWRKANPDKTKNAD